MNCSQTPHPSFQCWSLSPRPANTNGRFLWTPSSWTVWNTTLKLGEGGQSYFKTWFIRWSFFMTNPGKEKTHRRPFVRARSKWETHKNQSTERYYARRSTNVDFPQPWFLVCFSFVPIRLWAISMCVSPLTCVSPLDTCKWVAGARTLLVCSCVQVNIATRNPRHRNPS